LGERPSREFLAVLRLLVSRNDGISWWTLLHLADGIGGTVIDAIIEEAKRGKKRFGEALLKLHESEALESKAGKATQRKVKDTLELLDQIKIPEEASWGKWITDRIQEGTLPPVPAELRELLRKMDDVVEGAINLDKFVPQIQPLAQDLASARKSEAVRVMTMASSKGLTVTACIVMGCEGNIVPLPSGDRHEERRLLYVSMTRSREYLFLTRAKRRQGPTARVGLPRVQEMRTMCPFLEGGPVEPQDGVCYLKDLKKKK
jgi:superfamily I DNA/RNA helicase